LAQAGSSAAPCNQNLSNLTSTKQMMSSPLVLLALVCQAGAIDAGGADFLANLEDVEAKKILDMTESDPQAVQDPQILEISEHDPQAVEAKPAAKGVKPVAATKAKPAKEAQLEAKKEKENAEAIGGLVEGLNSLDKSSGATAIAWSHKKPVALVAPSTPNSTKPQVSTKAQDKAKKEKEEAAAGIGGLVKGLNSLPMSHGKVNPAQARLMKKSAALVSHSATPANATKPQLSTKAQDKAKKEKEEAAAGIGGLVKGLNALPMRGGRVVASQARRMKKPAALVSRAPPAPVKPAEAVAMKLADPAEQAKLQHEFDIADVAMQPIAQIEQDAHKDAEEARKILKSVH